MNLSDWLKENVVRVEFGGTGAEEQPYVDVTIRMGPKTFASLGLDDSEDPQPPDDPPVRPE
jgi:hypothetical protein